MCLNIFDKNSVMYLYSLKTTNMRSAHFCFFLSDYQLNTMIRSLNFKGMKKLLRSIVVHTLNYMIKINTVQNKHNGCYTLY